MARPTARTRQSPPPRPGRCRRGPHPAGLPQSPHRKLPPTGPGIWYGPQHGHDRPHAPSRDAAGTDRRKTRAPPCRSAAVSPPPAENSRPPGRGYGTAHSKDATCPTPHSRPRRPAAVALRSPLSPAENSRPPDPGCGAGHSGCVTSPTPCSPPGGRAAGPAALHCGPKSPLFRAYPQVGRAGRGPIGPRARDLRRDILRSHDRHSRDQGPAGRGVHRARGAACRVRPGGHHRPCPAAHPGRSGLRRGVPARGPAGRRPPPLPAAVRRPRAGGTAAEHRVQPRPGRLFPARPRRRPAGLRR